MNLLSSIVRWPLRFIPQDAVLPVMQGRLRGKRWIVRSAIHRCWLGMYERDECRLLEQTIRPGTVVFDIGANVGFYTLLASVLVGAAGRVFAFEPLPRNLTYLRRHLRLNNVQNVTVIEAAVLDHAGVASIAEGPPGSVGSMAHIAPGGNQQVRAVTVDELVATGQAPRPDYIKIDIEGAEGRALAGARSTLDRHHPTMFVATHGPKVHEECRRVLEALAYQLQPLDGESVERATGLFARARA